MKIFFFMVMAALAFAILGAAVMWLWNAILPDLLDVKRISYWQSVGLLVLSRLLFGSWKPRGGRPRNWGAPSHFKAKFMNMSEEERQAFKEEMRKRCARRRDAG